MYKKEYGEVFSNSKKPTITIAKTLTKITEIVTVGNGRGRKYKIEDYGNRWLIETLFEETKGEWYINKLPSRNLEAIAKRFD